MGWVLLPTVIDQANSYLIRCALADPIPRELVEDVFTDGFAHPGSGEGRDPSLQGQVPRCIQSVVTTFRHMEVPVMGITKQQRVTESMREKMYLPGAPSLAREHSAWFWQAIA